MRPKLVMLAGVTKRNRHAVMADVNDIVAGLGGWIIGHTLLSNIATTFRLALPADRLEAFRAGVAAAGVVLDAESSHVVSDAIAEQHQMDAEITASLNVTFMHDEPDLRREIPAVPG